MTTLLFRVVHYLPTAHLTLGLFAAIAALWVLFTSITEYTPTGLDDLATAGAICRWLAALYLLLAAALHVRLSRSGHEILTQTGMLWWGYLLVHALLLAVVLLVIARGPHSRVHMAGVHHGVAALALVSALSLAWAIIDRLAAAGVSRAVPEWSDEEPASPRGDRVGQALVVVGTMLVLALGYLETRPLPHAAPSEAQAANRPATAIGDNGVAVARRVPAAMA